jgi:hypothetical protein
MKWIPASRPPKDYNERLVLLTMRERWTWYHFGWYDLELKQWRKCGAEAPLRDVEFWLELPAPPKRKLRTAIDKANGKTSP